VFQEIRSRLQTGAVKFFFHTVQSRLTPMGEAHPHHDGFPGSASALEAHIAGWCGGWSRRNAVAELLRLTHHAGSARSVTRSSVAVLLLLLFERRWDLTRADDDVAGLQVAQEIGLRHGDPGLHLVGGAQRVAPRRNRLGLLALTGRWSRAEWR
jgi:hypothetical protein